jgi:hypothetical protein
MGGSFQPDYYTIGTVVLPPVNRLAPHPSRPSMMTHGHLTDTPGLPPPVASVRSMFFPGISVAARARLLRVQRQQFTVVCGLLWRDTRWSYFQSALREFGSKPNDQQLVVTKIAVASVAIPEATLNAALRRLNAAGLRHPYFSQTKARLRSRCPLRHADAVGRAPCRSSCGHSMRRHTGASGRLRMALPASPVTS